MKIKVNPNRMELLKLRKRLRIAQRGHKLLEDKLDELMQKFLNLIEEIHNLRVIVDVKLKEVYNYFISSSMVIFDKELKLNLSLIDEGLNLEIFFQRVMNLNLPQFKFEEIPDYFNYSLFTTSGELDFALEKLKELLPDLIRLIEFENCLRILSTEIEKTRRRVNALEYILMPAISQTIKDIQMRLSEIERGNLVRLMRVKEIVRAH